MAQPNSKATLVEYCKRRLGSPVLEINVDSTQIDDAIDYALEKFRTYNYDGIEKMYMKHKWTADDVTRFKADETAESRTIDGVTSEWTAQKNYLIVPDDVVSVSQVWSTTDKGTGNIFDMRYQIRLNDLYDFTSTQFYHYFIIQQHLANIDFMLEHFKPTRFSQVTNRLYIDLSATEDVIENEWSIIECYRYLDPTEHTRIYNDMWVKDYSTALIKKYWGQNLTKFTGVQLPGGVSLNGDKIYTDAVTELNALDDQLRDTYEMPPLDAVG